MWAQAIVVNYPALTGGALKFKTYFHVVIPAPVFTGINSSRNPGFPVKTGTHFF